MLSPRTLLSPTLVSRLVSLVSLCGLLAVRTGRVSPGGSAKVSGGRGDLLSLTHRLARQFHKRVTGTDLALNGDDSAEPASEPTPTSLSLPPRNPEEPDSVERADRSS